MKTLLIDIDDTLYKHTSPIQMMNYNNINEDKVLTEALNKIKYPKYIYTNAVFFHANTILNRMNLEDAFNKIYSRGTIPSMKPILNSAISVENDIKKNSKNIKTIIFFDDLLPNLNTGKKLGWTTVWIHPEYRKAKMFQFVDLAYPDIKSAILDNRF